jgi:hypothetical protein
VRLFNAAVNVREAQGTRAQDQVQESEKERPDGGLREPGVRHTLAADVGRARSRAAGHPRPAATAAGHSPRCGRRAGVAPLARTKTSSDHQQPRAPGAATKALYSLATHPSSPPGPSPPTRAHHAPQPPQHPRRGGTTHTKDPMRVSKIHEDWRGIREDTTKRVWSKI